ncbi:MAG: DUF1003 domain-containing protein [Rhizobiaceae bacterium]|nr:DUF1003 domain-containing protein [Rhizobiaceae bacterium]
MKMSIADLAGRWLKRKPDTLSDLENQVLRSAIERKPVATDTGAAYTESLSTGERLADALARVGGSWGFIIAFLTFLAVWTIANVWLLAARAFDPYPFIFLNLVLSMIAALQAPVIMMSQNRQAERDRMAAEHDYAVNLKAEIEIMALHEKFDEMRHQEIILMRQEVAELSAAVARVEARLAMGTKPEDL